MFTVFPLPSGVSKILLNLLQVFSIINIAEMSFTCYVQKSNSFIVSGFCKSQTQALDYQEKFTATEEIQETKKTDLTIL